MSARDGQMSDLTPDILIRTYAAGIFPMAESADDPTLFWVDPERRGVLPIDGFHVSRKLQKKLRRNPFEMRCDTAYEAVIRACGASRPERPKTWINSEIIRLYSGLFDMGHAHSVEAWRDGRMVGGLYGISIGGAFFGESMFSVETDASKLALCHLIARLRRSGYILLDTQFVTQHLIGFGAMEIDRADYRRQLTAALQVKAEFYLGPLDESDLTFRQSLTQTS
ncbi:MAG TPA: leucyl/phenylalanyl-tRNA--protein transferase [Alphaproteobacteria bacterium]|jgi:leucyl/phenylalanyl-tRNA--protein transferase